MYFGVRLGASAAAFVLLAACANAPLQETKNFATAVSELESASTPLFDQLSVAERKIGKRQAIRRASAVQARGATLIRTFRVEDASYFATLGDPPSVTIFRRSFKVIQTYSETLLALAENKSVAESQAHLQSIADNLRLIAIAGGIAAAANPLAAAIPVAVANLEVPIGRALAAQNAAEARRLVLEGAPLIADLISALRDAAPSILATLTNDSATAMARAAAAGGNQAVQPHADQAALQVTQVANYVVLLERLQNSFEAMMISYDRPSNPITLARLARETALLAADAAAFRKAYHTLRL